jgi:Rho GDP-dissociation inhibitor
MAESTEQPEQVPTTEPVGDEEEEVTPGYKTPAKKDLETIQKLDADDESLVKYKQQLLGQTTDVLGKKFLLSKKVVQILKYPYIFSMLQILSTPNF